MGILGLGGLASTILSARQYKNSKEDQEFTAKLNYDYNEMTADNAAERQKQFYDYTYNKESPEAQVNLYKEAGLNPALMYSGAGGSTSGSSQGAVQGQGVATTSQKQAAAAQLSQSMNQAELLGAQVANINADTKLKEKEAGNTEKDTELKTSQIELNKSIENLNTETSKGQQLKNDFQEVANDLQNKTFDITIETAKANKEYINKQIKRAGKDIARIAIDMENMAKDGKLKDQELLNAKEALKLTATETIYKQVMMSVAGEQIKSEKKKRELMTAQAQESVMSAINESMEAQLKGKNLDWYTRDKIGAIVNKAISAGLVAAGIAVTIGSGGAATPLGAGMVAGGVSWTSTSTK